MTILALDHVTVRTSKLEESRDFYVDVVGLSVGSRPSFKFPGYWLYVNEHPVLHLFDEDDEGNLAKYMGSRETSGVGAVDHVALRCNGIDEFRARFAAQSVEVLERTVPELGQHQIFLKDPNGVTVELIFAADGN